MTLEDYILEAVSHGRKHAILTSDMKIDDFISALDISGFQQKSAPGTGARAVFLFQDAKKKDRRMYFVDREKPCIWAVIPEDDTAYHFEFCQPNGIYAGRILEVSIYVPVKKGTAKPTYDIDYLSQIKSFYSKGEIEEALKELSNILS